MTRIDRKQQIMMRGKRNTVRLVVMAIVVGLLLIGAFFSEQLCPCDPYLQDLMHAKAMPSKVHLWGTDQFGRDMLSRVIIGSKTSIFSALLVVGIVLVMGTTVGLVAALKGGWIEIVLMRISDLFLAFPSLLFALAVAGAFGGGLHNAVIALSAISWPKYARLTAGLTLTEKEASYIKAAKLAGDGTWQIIGWHLLPNIMGPVFVTAMLDVGTVIMEMAGLSFLGLGAKPPLAEWGSMMSTSRSLLVSAPWIVLSPGMGIFISVALFNLFGDALRDYLDPKGLDGGK